MKCVILMVIILSLIPIHAGISEMIEVPREELIEYLERMEKDRETIKELIKEKLELQMTMTLYESKLNEYKAQVKRSKGLYIGGNIGYPFLNVDLILMYKFEDFGLYLLGGYNQGFNINAGAIFKLGQ